MKQYIEVLKDKFVDYKGETHQYIIVAISESFDETAIIAVRNEQKSYDKIDEVIKGIKIGIAICNPEDTFDEKRGIMKACGRAKNSSYVMYATEKKFINGTLVKGLLQQESEYIQDDPGKYITGYDDAKKRWEKKQEMTKLAESFNDTEKTIVEEVKKDSKFLDNVQKYLKWLGRK